MSNKIVFPLMILMFCACLTQIIKVSNFTFQASQSRTIPSENQSTTYEVPAIDFLGIDGMLALLIGFIALGAGVGIHFLGSGLSDSSIAIIYKSLFYYTLWGIFSVLGLGIGDSGLSSIPLIGILFYIFLTVIYTIGVQGQILTHEA